jgi:hypothetical protein
MGCLSKYCIENGVVFHRVPVVNLVILLCFFINVEFLDSVHKAARASGV